jgi:hypothetical protein
MADQWHALIDGLQRGPLSGEQLRSLAGKGQLKPSDHIWKEGMPAWVEASSVRGLFPQQLMPQSAGPGAAPANPLSATTNTSPRHMSPLNEVDVRSLPFSAKAALTWSFLWRGLLITILSSVLGGLVGGLAGFVLGVLGFPLEAISLVAGLGGFAIGMACIFLWIQWLLTSRLGGFRLKLVRTDQ